MDLASFQRDFHGDLISLDHPEFAQAIARWAINATRKAKIVTFVKDPSDIALAIKFAKANRLSLAIRCGGHSTAGASSAEDGLVIDLSRYMNSVRIDADQKVAHVGGGTLWEAVDKAAIEHGLATVGGSVNHTGVSGLLLGGGYGWLTGEHGLTIDNFVEATMVLADGSVVKASESENADLFWAIRGGGCNFGVLVEAVLKLHPQRRTIYAGYLIFTPDKLEELLKVTDEWWSRGISGKEAMHHFFRKDPRGSPHPVIIALVYYNGTEAEGRENFKAFIELGPVMDTTKEIPYEEMNGIQNPQLEPGMCRYLKGFFHMKPDLASYRRAMELAVERTTDEHTVVFIVEYVSLKKMQSVPNGTTAFRRGVGANGFVALAWKRNTLENTTYARNVAHEISDVAIAGQSELDAALNFGYGNYDHDVHVEGEVTIMKNKAPGLFGDNYPRLQQLKKKYDPDVVFDKWFVINPAD